MSLRAKVCTALLWLQMLRMMVGNDLHWALLYRTLDFKVNHYKIKDNVCCTICCLIVSATCKVNPVLQLEHGLPRCMSKFILQCSTPPPRNPSASIMANESADDHGSFRARHDREMIMMASSDPYHLLAAEHSMEFDNVDHNVPDTQPDSQITMSCQPFTSGPETEHPQPDDPETEIPEQTEFIDLTQPDTPSPGPCTQSHGGHGPYLTNRDLMVRLLHRGRNPLLDASLPATSLFSLPSSPRSPSPDDVMEIFTATNA